MKACIMDGVPSAVRNANMCFYTEHIYEHEALADDFLWHHYKRGSERGGVRERGDWMDANQSQISEKIKATKED